MRSGLRSNGFEAKLDKLLDRLIENLERLEKLVAETD